MTVKELREALADYPENMPVWVYEPNDEDEPYQGIDSVGRSAFGDIVIYRE